MLSRQQLLTVVDDWAETLSWIVKNLKPRSVEPIPLSHHALGLVGVRRSGKSWLAIEQGKTNSANTLYVNFEDPAFLKDAEVTNLDGLVSVFEESRGHLPKFIIYDEIQNIEGWERWVRKVIDRREFQLIITGSSAKLLSSEISSSITGRCLEYYVWPLSYLEFLKFREKSPQTINEHRNLFKEYLKWGGFPEIVLESDERIKKKLLLQYGQDLVSRDIVNRYEIRNKRALDQIFLYYASHVSCLHSYQAIKKAFQITVDLASDYTRYLNEAFYCFELSRFHQNLKVQFRDPKKIYLIDTGLRNVYSNSPNEDLGRLVENVVYVELRRRGKELSYFRGKKECDFVVSQFGVAKEAIQVCFSNMEDKETYDREMNGALEAMDALGLKKGVILTESRRDVVKVGGKREIELVPIYDWLTVL